MQNLKATIKRTEEDGLFGKIDIITITVESSGIMPDGPVIDVVKKEFAFLDLDAQYYVKTISNFITDLGGEVIC